jgi:two-component system response regulator YesN
MKRESLARSRLDSVTDWEARAKLVKYRVSVLADQLHVSERQLRRFFLNRRGKAVHVWLRELRLMRAAAELQQGKYVKEAAELAGFKHQPNFSRSFAYAFGLPPSAFRSRPTL